jgi:SAM-dependent methyltransferase
MRDYARFDQYLDRLSQDIYAQPPDPGHTAWAMDAVRSLCTIPQGITNVLDAGCGQGFLAEAFTDMGLAYTGITLGEDFKVCQSKGLNVYEADMTFLPFEDKSFDLVFARHVLEHSPFPILTLMEWKRVSRGWLVLVAPAPGYWGQRGRNHYSVVPLATLEWWLARAGWAPIHSLFLTNRSPRFIEFWELYQVLDTEEESETAMQLHAVGIDTPEQLLEENPEVIVEYRLLCEPIQEKTD